MAALETCLSGHILGLTSSPALPISICLSGHSSDVATLVFPRQNQAEAHYKGHKHARRLKAIEAMKNKQKVVGAAAGTPGQDSTADLAPSPVGSGELGSTGRRRGRGAEEAAVGVAEVPLVYK